MHPISIEFDFLQPVGAVRCLLSERGELRFDPGRWRSRFNPSAGRERVRRVRASGFRHRDHVPEVRPCRSVMSWMTFEITPDSGGLGGGKGGSIVPTDTEY